MASAYGNTRLSLNGLAFQHSDGLLCGYCKIFNGVVLDKGNPTSPKHIKLSYSDDGHTVRTFVGFNYYSEEKRFESDLEWIIRTKDVNSQALHFKTEKLKLQAMMPEERQFLTRLLMQLENIAPALLSGPRSLTSRIQRELKIITVGYPENFRSQFQEKAPLGQAYSLQRFSVPMPPESWGQSAPKNGRGHWWQKAPEFPEESSRVCTGRYG